jgi:hypothetical protein
MYIHVIHLSLRISVFVIIHFVIISNYKLLANRLSPLMLWVWLPLRARCTTLCDKVCEGLATGRWFSPGFPVSSSNKTSYKKLQRKKNRKSQFHNMLFYVLPLHLCLVNSYTMKIQCLQIWKNPAIYKLFITANRGSSWKGDIAIDNLQLHNDVCCKSFIVTRWLLWSYGSWIYNYLCHQCLSPLTLWVGTLLKRGELNTTF